MLTINREKGSIGILLFFIIFIVGLGVYLFTASKNKPIVKTSPVEVARHTFYKNNVVSETILEENRRFPDGSLETKISQGDKNLSRLLFTHNNIYRLSEGILTRQVFKAASKSDVSYLTNREQITSYIKNTPSIMQTIDKVSGKKMKIYTLGNKQTSFLPFIRFAYAQEEGSLTKIYTEEETGVILKIEQLNALNKQPIEVIEYEDNLPLPVPLPIPIEVNETDIQPPALPEEEQLKLLSEQMLKDLEDQIKNSQPPDISNEDKLRFWGEEINRKRQAEEAQNQAQIEDVSPVVVLADMNKEITEIKTVQVAPPIVFDKAILLEPLSVIPVGNSYNSPVIQLSSTLFNKQDLSEKEIKEKGMFNTLEFTKNNFKVRIDGVEFNENLALNSGETNSTNEPWKLLVNLPTGLTPGFHTLEVYMTNSWYLAPNLLVALPAGGEEVTEVILDSDAPPLAFTLPDNQGYRIILKGKNFAKPLSVYVGTFQLNDNNIEIVGNDQLILTIPTSISTGIHDLTIIQGSQKVFRPAFLFLGNPQ